jgi:glutamate---cysteine ligase / carboxylate-amine ligase
VLIAALCRALVDTEARRWRAGADLPPRRTEMLRLAAWRASRSGLDDVLLDPRTRPAGAGGDGSMPEMIDSAAAATIR